MNKILKDGKRHDTRLQYVQQYASQIVTVIFCFILLSSLFTGDMCTLADDTKGITIISGTTSIRGVEITHINNSGILFTSGNEKILVDALYQGVDEWTVPENILKSMQQGVPPFDGIDLVLTTHTHQDHFDALSVGELLENNPDTLYVCNEDAENTLTFQYPQYDEVTDQVTAITVNEKERATLILNGIELEVIGMRHGWGLAGRNYGYLFTIGGATILHVGDALLECADMKEYQFPQDEIDIVFIPWWYIMNDEYARAIKEEIQAEQICIIHTECRIVNYEEYTWEWITEQIEIQFPGAIVFYEPQTQDVNGEKKELSPNETKPSNEASQDIIPEKDDSTGGGICMGTHLLWCMLLPIILKRKK